MEADHYKKLILDGNEKKYICQMKTFYLTSNTIILVLL